MYTVNGCWEFHKYCDNPVNKEGYMPYGNTNKYKKSYNEKEIHTLVDKQNL